MCASRTGVPAWPVSPGVVPQDRDGLGQRAEDRGPRDVLHHVPPTSAPGRRTRPAAARSLTGSVRPPRRLLPRPPPHPPSGARLEGELMRGGQVAETGTGTPAPSAYVIACHSGREHRERPERRGAAAPRARSRARPPAARISGVRGPARPVRPPPADPRSARCRGRCPAQGGPPTDRADPGPWCRIPKNGGADGASHSGRRRSRQGAGRSHSSSSAVPDDRLQVLLPHRAVRDRILHDGAGDTAGLCRPAAATPSPKCAASARPLVTTEIASAADSVPLGDFEPWPGRPSVTPWRRLAEDGDHPPDLVGPVAACPAGPIERPSWATPGGRRCPPPARPRAGHREHHGV